MNNSSSLRYALRTSAIAASLLAFGSLAVQAHPHHIGGGFTGGVTHPLGGFDHLLAMLAVGLWATQIGGSARYLVPLGFIGAVIVGGVLGMGKIEVPFIEEGILASVLVFGLLVARSARLRPMWSLPLVALFALLHGHAHGTEVPAGVDGLAYIAGFVAATAALHGAGLLVGSIALRRARPAVVRYAGAAIVAAGIVLVLGVS